MVVGSINATRSTRRRALLAAVAMLATTIAVLASSPAPAWAANGTLSGVLTSSVGATPVGGVTVEAYGGYYGNLWGTATSDADGSFELSLPSGDFRIRYVDPTGAHTTVYWGGATTYVTATTVHVPGGGAATADWTLPAAASIGGTVTSSVGPPLAGVTVEVLDAASATVLTTAVTAADGTWARAVAPGNRKLRATAVDAHITQTFSGNATDLSSAATIVVGPLADVEHDLIMATPAALVGTVRKAGSVPVAGVTVEALDPVWGGVIDTTATGADGTYLLALPAGTYRVRFHDPGGVLADRYSGGSLDWASSSTVAVPPGAATTVNATLANNPRVRGRVRTPAQVYLGGITVQAVGLNGVPAASTTTAADGTYDLSVLPGSYRVRFLDPGGTYAMTYEGGAAAPGGAPVHTLAVGQIVPVNHKLSYPGSLTGRARIGAFGPGITGVYVGAFTPTTLELVGIAQTAANGTWTIAGLPTGTYKVAYVDPRWLATDGSSFMAFRPVFSPGHDIDDEGLTTAAANAASVAVAAYATTDLGDEALVGADCDPAVAFPGADLSGWTAPFNQFGNFAGCPLAGADLSGAQWIWADLRATDLTDADLTGATLYAGIVDPFNGINVHWPATMTGARITGANLTDAAVLPESLLATDPDWSGTNLDARLGWPFTTSGMPDPGLRIFEIGIGPATGFTYEPLTPDSTSPALVLHGATLRKAMIDGLAGRSISDFTCIGCRFGVWDPWSSTLTPANLTGTSLTGSNLTGSDLRGAGLGGTDLSAANLTNVTLAGAVGTPAGWATAIFQNTTCPDGTIASPATAQTTCVGHELP